MKKFTFSVVINTLNRAAHLRSALKALERQRLSTFEVIVVNGPSTDDTEAVLEEWKSKIKIGTCDEANLSKSRNIGIAMSRGDVICFLDDDAIPEPDWLERLQESYQEDDLGGVGGFVRDHGGVGFQCMYTVCDRFGDSRRVESPEDLAKYLLENESSYVSQTGCNSSFRRSALLQIKGFDEYFAYFLDETDVNLRIADAGWRLKINPNAEVHHKYAPSALRDHKNIPKRLYLPLRSKAYFALRHAKKGTPLDSLFERLADHASGIQRHNDWYLNHNEITQEHYDTLSEDVLSGVRDGVAHAFTQTEPDLLKQSTLEKFQAMRFKRFGTLSPNGGRLRLCFLSREYPPGNCGGIGVWTHHVAKGLAEKGHEVSVVTLSESGAHTVDLEDGVWVHRIVQKWQGKRNTPSLGDIPQVIKDYAYCAYDEVQRIYLRRGLDLVSAPIWDLEGLACHASGEFTTITSLHTTFQLALPYKPDWNRNSKYLKNHVQKIIEGEKKLLQEGELILANSKSIVADLENFNPGLKLKDRAKVVYHGIPGASEYVDGVEVETIKSAEKTSEIIDVLFVGRLEARKGIDTLLRAMHSVCAADERVRFSIVGNDQIPLGDYVPREKFTSQYPNLIEAGRVRFFGFVDDSELDRLYSECDIFVAPSRYESFGLIFLEAMRFGKPCVGTCIGGIKEVVEDQVTGVLISPDDAEALKEALLALSADAKLREKFGQAGLNRFNEMFSLTTMIGGLENYYHDIIDTKKRAKATKQGLLA